MSADILKILSSSRDSYPEIQLLQKIDIHFQFLSPAHTSVAFGAGLHHRLSWQADYVGQLAPCAGLAIRIRVCRLATLG